MDVEMRIQMCRMLQRMQEDPQLAEDLGLKDISVLDGQMINGNKKEGMTDRKDTVQYS